MDRFFEEIKLAGSQLVDKVHEVLHEGNVRRIILKDEHGHTLMEVPLTVAAVGVIAAPVLASVGALAALVTKCTLVVERVEHKTPEPPKPQ